MTKEEKPTLGKLVGFPRKNLAPLPTYERDDREALSPLLSALGDLQVFGEVLLLMEKYGLSLAFASERIEWTCTDPEGRYGGEATTPAGAVLMWSLAREDTDRDDGESDVDYEPNDEDPDDSE